MTHGHVTPRQTPTRPTKERVEEIRFELEQCAVKGQRHELLAHIDALEAENRKLVQLGLDSAIHADQRYAKLETERDAAIRERDGARAALEQRDRDHAVQLQDAHVKWLRSEGERDRAQWEAAALRAGIRCLNQIHCGHPVKCTPCFAVEHADRIRKGEEI